MRSRALVGTWRCCPADVGGGASPARAPVSMARASQAVTRRRRGGLGRAAPALLRVSSFGILFRIFLFSPAACGGSGTVPGWWWCWCCSISAPQ